MHLCRCMCGKMFAQWHMCLSVSMCVAVHGSNFVWNMWSSMAPSYMIDFNVHVQMYVYAAVHAMRNQRPCRRLADPDCPQRPASSIRIRRGSESCMPGISGPHMTGMACTLRVRPHMWHRGTRITLPLFLSFSPSPSVVYTYICICIAIHCV